VILLTVKSIDYQVYSALEAISAYMQSSGSSFCLKFYWKSFAGKVKGALAEMIAAAGVIISSEDTLP
jgi:hypothetical protein